MDVIDPIMETGESFLGIEDDQNTLQVRILEYLKPNYFKKQRFSSSFLLT